MTIGHGDIAGVLPSRNDLLFFASGVSNSLEVRESEYARERQLFFQMDRKMHIVYFSTLSIFYKTSRYVQHKLDMEDLVRSLYKQYTIIRIGNITWGNNPNTLINYMKNKLDHGEPVEIRDEYRYIVDKEEFLHWIDLIPEFSCEINIPGKRMKVQEIVDKYCVTKYPLSKEFKMPQKFLNLPKKGFKISKYAS